MKNKKISDLTIDEFKDTIREVVAEELMKRNFSTPTYIPTPQPYYCPCQPNPYKQQEVWVTSSIAEAEEMLKKRETHSLDTIPVVHNKLTDAVSIYDASKTDCKLRSKGVNRDVH